MATYKGVNKTIVDAISPSTVLSPGVMGSSLRVMIGSYTALGTELAASIIEFCDELPLGAKVIDVIIHNGDGAAAMKIGDYESTGRYEAAVAAGVTAHANTVSFGYEVDMTTASTPDNQIIVTTSAATLTVDLVTTVIVLYSVE